MTVTRCLAAASLLLAAAPATSGAATTSRLARVTAVTGRTNAVTTVTLPRAATVRIDVASAQSDNVTVTGNGRVAGFDLRLDNGSATPPHLFAALTNGCYTGGCAPRARYVSTVASGFHSTKVGAGTLTQYTLAAGRYRLLLIADGTPVTVRLRLDGLTGTATVKPAAAAAVRWQPLKANATVGSPPALLAYSAPAGVLPVGSRGGILFTVFDVWVSAGDANRRGFCYSPTPDNGRVNGPGCPGAQDDRGENITGPILQEHALRGLQFIDGTLATQPGSTGLYYTGVAAVESIDALSVQIAY